MQDILMSSDLPASLSVLAAFDPVGLVRNIWSVLVMLLGFSLIVFVHELGHFAVAKWAGVRVDRFAIGFGKELFGFTKGETRYSFNLLPLGGYVKMLGQEDFDDKSNELKFSDDPRSFVNKPVHHRMAIVSAGVIMNIIFAFVLFMVVFMVGMRAIAPSVQYVLPDSPADQAGLQPGDVIREIDGAAIRDWNEVTMAVLLAPPFEPVEFIVERNGELQSPIYVTPESNTDHGKQTIGIQPSFRNVVTAVGGDPSDYAEGRPRVGDKIVEVAGTAIDETNMLLAVPLIAESGGEFTVERTPKDQPNAQPQRLTVRVPLQMLLQPDDSDRKSRDVLGLQPYVAVTSVDPKGPAWLAGLEAGDVILMFDDIEAPSREQIRTAYRDQPDVDLALRYRTRDGRVVNTFVRPVSRGVRPGTMQAQVVAIEDAAGGPEARFEQVRPGGAADQAGIEDGDVVVRFHGVENPTAEHIRRLVSDKAGRKFQLTVRRPNGALAEAVIRTRAPGSVNASFDAVGNDYLRIAAITPSTPQRPSPAEMAGIPAGAFIREMDGQPVEHWHEIIAAFQAAAGNSVAVTYEVNKERATARMRVPQTLRTALGLGSFGRIVSIDGKTEVTTGEGDDRRTLQILRAEGMRKLLESLVGQTVEVSYRANGLAPLERAEVAITPEMLDPWLSRVVLQPSLGLEYQSVLVQERNPIKAIQLGVKKTHMFVMQVYQTIERMAFSRTVGAESISGPVGIVAIGAQVAKKDMAELLFFLAILSANLAVINFLPLPIVDGGLMVFLIIEAIKGTPVSLRVQVATQIVGLVLIASAFIWVTFNDVIRMWG